MLRPFVAGSRTRGHGCTGPRVFLCVLALAQVLAACTTTQPPVPTPAPRTPAPAVIAPAPRPTPHINLAGYPPPFKEGFRDGCDSFRGAYRRDAVRFKSDANYAMGWQDGYDICRRQAK